MGDDGRRGLAAPGGAHGLLGKERLSTLLVVLALVVSVGLVVLAEATHSAAQQPGAALVVPPGAAVQRPDIVLISTDDQTLSDLRYMARTKDLLAHQGMSFANMLSPHPLCCPARAELITGQFAQNNGVHSNEGPYGGYPNLLDPNDNLGAWLQSGGYRTAVVGKFLNQWTPKLGIPTGWTHWQTSVKSEFGYYGYTMDIDGTNVTYPPSGPYSTDLVSAVTDKLIDRWGPSGSPFFIWSSYYAPHGLCGEQEGCRHPPVPAHRYADYPVREEATSLRDPAFDERDVSDKPDLIQRQGLVSARFAQRDFADRIRSLQSVDDAVARTFRHLRAAGVLGDTYVMFTSDNGYLIGEHRYIGKILPYEPALRVPLLVRGPGIAPGSHTASTVTTVDLASTITDLAGVTPGRTPDGVSLVPLLHGGPPPARDTTLIQAGGLGSGPRTAPWLYRGVRTARYTFAVWDDQGPPFPELYDRSVDPDELLNVADDPRYAAVVEALSARLQALQDCAGAACNTEFGPLPVVPHAVALRAVRGAD